MRRTISINIRQLHERDLVEGNDKDNTIIMVKHIERRDRKYFPWIITWSNGTTTEHSDSARFRVIWKGCH